MKYVWIAVAVIVLVRIDLVLHLFDKAREEINAPEQPQIRPADIEVDERDIVSIPEDQTLKRTPRKVFFSLLEHFKIYPDKAVRENIMDVLRKNPDLLGTQLDPDFEAAVFRWRDHIYQNEPELPLLLLELMDVLDGENREVIRRFYALILDDNVATFMRTYSRSKDSNCMIAGIIGDRLGEDEKYLLLKEREQEITAFLAREKIDPIHRLFARNCHMVVTLELSKMTPPVLPEDRPLPTETQEASP